MPDGRYVLGGQAVQVVNGAARLADNPGALAGQHSGDGCRPAPRDGRRRLTLAEALPMATMVPARAIGLDGRKGSLAAGLDADLTVLDEDSRSSAPSWAGARCTAGG